MMEKIFDPVRHARAIYFFHDLSSNPLTFYIQTQIYPTILNHTPIDLVDLCSDEILKQGSKQNKTTIAIIDLTVAYSTIYEF